MRGRSKSTIELIQFARQLLTAAHPMTLRQLHYAIFSASKIAYTNTERDYHRLSRVTVVARRSFRDWVLRRRKSPLFRDPEPAYSIPYDWIVDETRNPETQNVFDDAEAYIDAVGCSYRRDNWRDQPEYCEVWSEKGTVLATLRPVAKELGLTLRVCHGFGSCGMEMQIGDHFAIEKPITVFYLGDHDPSGHDIERDLHEKVQRAAGVSFDIQRLAIHAADIRAFGLPPQRIKNSDSRAAAFRQKYGMDAQSVELDALPVEEIRQRVEAAVSELIDWEIWKRAVEIQEVELASIEEGTRYMRALLGK